MRRPIARAVRMTRQAISPRLAIRSVRKRRYIFARSIVHILNRPNFVGSIGAFDAPTKCRARDACRRDRPRRHPTAARWRNTDCPGSHTARGRAVGLSPPRPAHSTWFSSSYCLTYPEPNRNEVGGMRHQPSHIGTLKYVPLLEFNRTWIQSVSGAQRWFSTATPRQSSSFLSNPLAVRWGAARARFLSGCPDRL